LDKRAIIGSQSSIYASATPRPRSREVIAGLIVGGNPFSVSPDGRAKWPYGWVLCGCWGTGEAAIILQPENERRSGKQELISGLRKSGRKGAV